MCFGVTLVSLTQRSQRPRRFLTQRTLSALSVFGGGALTRDHEPGRDGDRWRTLGAGFTASPPRPDTKGRLRGTRKRPLRDQGWEDPLAGDGRIDDLKVGEPFAHKTPVAGNKRVGTLQRMRPNEKIGDNRKP